MPLNEEFPISTTGATTPGAIEERPGHRSNGRGQTARRRLTETKASFKTSEFLAFLVVLAGILVSAAVVDETNDGGFGAKQAWLYATILAVGYMVSRGLAKSGSSQPCDEDRS